MGGPAENLATARQYIRAIESGARGDEIAQFFAPEAVVEIFPSRFFPNGSRDDLAGIRAAADRGSKAMTRQAYEIKNELSSGDTVALEIVWTGILAVPFQSKPAGAQMRSRFAAFLQFKDGRIVAQRNYDCYDP
jgi:ketosteroid isomerase-like protein